MLHWNIHSWRDITGAPNVGQVASLIRSVEPDVVSLVEVEELWSQTTTIAALADELGYAHVFVPAFEFGDDGHGEGGFGNALLSRPPITAVRHRQLTWPTRPYDGSEPSEMRSATFVLLEAGAGPVWVGSTHLPRSDSTARSAALRALCDCVGALAMPWVICGDFNTAPDWAHASGLRAVGPVVPTYPSDRPMEPIDYFLVSPQCTATSQVLPDSGSDHLATLLTVSAFSESRDDV